MYITFSCPDTPLILAHKILGNTSTTMVTSEIPPNSKVCTSGQKIMKEVVQQSCRPVMIRLFGPGASPAHSMLRDQRNTTKAHTFSHSQIYMLPSVKPPTMSCPAHAYTIMFKCSDIYVDINGLPSQLELLLHTRCQREWANVKNMKVYL